MQNTDFKLGFLFYFLLILLFGVLAFFAYIEFGDSQNLTLGKFFPSQISDIETSKKTQNFPTLLSSDPSFGDKASPITIVEYGDFQCPACALAHKTIEEYLLKSGDTFRWVWKDLANPAHPQSFSAALAARCAQSQGKFWEFASLLFENQDQLSESFYSRVATELKMDTSSFDTCVRSTTHKQLVETSTTEAIDLGVEATPTLYINNNLFTGDINYFRLQSFIYDQKKIIEENKK